MDQAELLGSWKEKNETGGTSKKKKSTEETDFPAPDFGIGKPSKRVLKTAGSEEKKRGSGGPVGRELLKKIEFIRTKYQRWRPQGKERSGGFVPIGLFRAASVYRTV